MIPLRLVVDRNILVSAALKPDGLQRTVLLLAITKPARLYVSILTEYREVLSRPESQIRKGLRQQLLDMIRKRTHLVNPVRAIQVANDPEYDKFIECADAARADYPSDREHSALSKVLEEYQGRHVSRVPQPSGAASCRLEAIG